jgi:hypothetical protein
MGNHRLFTSEGFSSGGGPLARIYKAVDEIKAAAAELSQHSRPRKQQRVNSNDLVSNVQEAPPISNCSLGTPATSTITHVTSEQCQAEQPLGQPYEDSYYTRPLPNPIASPTISTIPMGTAVALTFRTSPAQNVTLEKTDIANLVYNLK